MIKSFLILSILMSSIINLFSQEKTQEYDFLRNNSITIFSGTTLTKTNFETEMRESGGFVGQLMDQRTPNKPLVGHFFGFSYNRWFKNKWSIGLSFRNTTKGQQSSNFFDTRASEPGGTTGNYGGTRIVAKLITNEITLHFLRTVRNKSKHHIYWTAGLSMDTHSLFEIKDFIIERENGIERVGCCTSFSNTKRDDQLKWFTTMVSRKNFRIGFSLGMGIDWRLWRGLNLRLQPELEYLTKTISSQPRIASGTIMLIGIQTGLSYNF